MSNFNYNSVQLGGRLTIDPQLKVTPSGVSVTTFSIAINRRVAQGQPQQSDFYNIICWRNTAEFVAKYFKKGTAIFIRGELLNKNWTDKNNIQHYGVEIRADECYFIDSKNDQVSKQNEELNLQPIDPDQPLPF